MSAIREWAKASGLEVGDRGRISHDIFVAYLEANPSVAREYLKAQGYTVGKRGRVSKFAILEATAK